MQIKKKDADFINYFGRRFLFEFYVLAFLLLVFILFFIVQLIFFTWAGFFAYFTNEHNEVELDLNGVQIVYNVDNFNPHNEANLVLRTYTGTVQEYTDTPIPGVKGSLIGAVISDEGVVYTMTTDEVNYPKEGENSYTPKDANNLFIHKHSEGITTLVSKYNIRSFGEQAEHYMVHGTGILPEEEDNTVGDLHQTKLFLTPDGGIAFYEWVLTTGDKYGPNVGNILLRDVKTGNTRPFFGISKSDNVSDSSGSYGYRIFLNSPVANQPKLSYLKRNSWYGGQFRYYDINTIIDESTTFGLGLIGLYDHITEKYVYEFKNGEREILSVVKCDYGAEYGCSADVMTSRGVLVSSFPLNVIKQYGIITNTDSFAHQEGPLRGMGKREEFSLSATPVTSSTGNYYVYHTTTNTSEKNAYILNVAKEKVSLLGEGLHVMFIK